ESPPAPPKRSMQIGALLLVNCHPPKQIGLLADAGTGEPLVGALRSVGQIESQKTGLEVDAVLGEFAHQRRPHRQVSRNCPFAGIVGDGAPAHAYKASKVANR